MGIGRGVEARRRVCGGVWDDTYVARRSEPGSEGGMCHWEGGMDRPGSLLEEEETEMGGRAAVCRRCCWTKTGYMSQIKFGVVIAVNNLARAT